jgi:polysaccharide biosynthesis protein PslH
LADPLPAITGDQHPMPRVLMLVSASADAELRRLVAAGERPCPEFIRLEQDFGVELLDWSSMGGKPGRSVARSARHLLAAAQRLDTVDVVFSDGEHLGLPLALALRAARRRPAQIMIGHHLTTRAKRALCRVFGIQADVDLVLVHSRRQLSNAMNTLGIPRTRIRLLPYYVDTEFWRPLPLAEENLVVAPGLEHRDHRTLVSACADLPIHLYVAAHSAHSARARVAMPETWPANVQQGRLDSMSLREMYSRSKVVAVPLLPADFPAGVTTVLEAMACGRALVVSATEGRPDVLRHGENCLLVPPGDSNALRGAIRSLLDDRAERRRLGSNAIVSAREHSLDRYVSDIGENLRSVASPGASRLNVGHTRTRPATSSRRRILVLTPQLPYPPDWGFAMRVYQMVRHLGAQHDVTLVSFSGDRDDEARQELGRLCGAIHTVDAGLPWGRAKRRLQLRSLASRRSYQLLSHAAPQMQQFVDELLTSEHFDLIQVESSRLGHLRFGSDAALLLDEHNIEYELLGRVSRTERGLLRKAFNALEQAKFRREEQASWRRFGACITTSAREESILRQRMPWASTAVIPNGVDSDHFAPDGVPVEPDTIVFTGQLDYRPNVDALDVMVAEVMPLVRRRRPAARLVAVGSFDNEEVPRFAGPGVTLTGRVADVRPYLASGAVTVAPLRMGSGTRLKVLEALSMARPMVSTSIGREGLELVDGEHLMVADDWDLFAAMIVNLLENPNQARELGRRGRELVRIKYDWRAITSRLDAVHASLLDRLQPPTETER